MPGSSEFRNSLVLYSPSLVLRHILGRTFQKESIQGKLGKAGKFGLTASKPPLFFLFSEPVLDPRCLLPGDLSSSLDTAPTRLRPWTARHPRTARLWTGQGPVTLCPCHTDVLARPTPDSPKKRSQAVRDSTGASNLQREGRAQKPKAGTLGEYSGQ